MENRSMIFDFNNIFVLIRTIINNKVFRNFSYLTLGSLFSQLIGILTIIKITSLLSTSNYGIYTFIMSQGALLFVIADLGITNILIRNIARDNLQTNDLIFNGAITRFFSVLGLTLLYLLYNSFLGSLTPLQLLFVCLFALINCFSHLSEIVFLGNQRMLLPSLINFSYNLIWFLIVYLLPYKYININSLFSIFLALNAIKALISFSLLKYLKLLIGEVHNCWHSSKRILKESWPYFSLVLIMTPVNLLSNNFLELNSNMIEIGYFNLSQKLMLPVSFVLGFALSAIFPNLSSLWVKNRKRFYYLVSIGFKYFILAASILCFLFTLFAKEVVTLLFNDSYLPAVKICQLQVWFVFLMGVNSLIGTILSAVNEDKLILRLGIINALVSTPMLYYGSKYGAMGISYAYVISFIISGIYIWHVFKKSINLRIKNDLLLWMLIFLLFVISYFIVQNFSIAYKILCAFIIIGAGTTYLFKTIQTIQLK